MLYTIGFITCIGFYLLCFWLYVFFNRLLDKLESLDDNLENIRVDLNVAKVEVRRAQQLIERQDAV